MAYTNIVVLTGAGISAESGLGTFRDVDGLWTKYDLNDVCTPEGFARNPQLVFDFYNTRRSHMLEAKANPAHFALAKLEEHLTTKKAEFTLVTQNVDNLHEQAGSKNVVHMHGELTSALCAVCGYRGEWLVDMEPGTACPQCAHEGLIRPDIVWFGEIPYHMERIYDAIARADMFVSIGTSGNVYPAAMFVEEAGRYGAVTVELNLEPSENATAFSQAQYGKASEIVPDWVEKLIS